MATFYMVYLDTKPSMTAETVKSKMNKALDWYRINSKTWILYSSSSADKLYARLSPLVKKGGHIFICELNTNNRQGWMQKSFWEWLKKER